MRIAYLYSRYPVVSQTFCDSEMLALEALGFELEVISLNPPPDSFRHERLDRLKAEIHYPPPDEVLRAKAVDPEFERRLGSLIAAHEVAYGPGFKARQRARNAWYFASVLRRLGVEHVHVHFANRATHTALFLKQLGFRFSFTAHAQDFMVDLGNDDLLREMVREAAFVVAVSDYSRNLLAATCPPDAGKIVRIYNGIELGDFPAAQPERAGALRMVSIGRLIEFKGFQHLIDAAGELRKRGVDVEVRILGEGPWRPELEARIAAQALTAQVRLLGVCGQEQIKRELAEAHLFVLPSIVDRKGASDVLPTVITEAMGSTLPVVSTTVAGIPEMVEEGVTGLLTAPGRVEELADAIQKLHRDVELRRRMGQAGRARAEALFALPVTAGQLAGRFSGLPKGGGSAEGAGTVGRREAEIAYWMEAWDPQSEDLAGLASDRRLWILAGAAGAADEDRPWEGWAEVDFLPDACVLESCWLRRPEDRRKVESARRALGDGLDGDEFYKQARRAVYLARALSSHGIRHLHAWRSDAVVCVWLVKQLIGLRVSAAVEESPSVGRAALTRMLRDFDLVSNSDKKLAANAGFLAKDELDLVRSPDHREFRVGPLRFKRKIQAVKVPRGDVERRWLEKIHQSLHA